MIAHFTGGRGEAQRAGGACRGKSWVWAVGLAVPHGPDAFSPLGGKVVSREPPLSVWLLWQPPPFPAKGRGNQAGGLMRLPGSDVSLAARLHKVSVFSHQRQPHV